MGNGPNYGGDIASYLYRGRSRQLHRCRRWFRFYGLGSRVSGSGARWPEVLGPRRRRQDTRSPGRLTDPAIRVLLLWLTCGRQWCRMVHDCGRRARVTWRRWPDRGHFQVPSRVQQRPDSQRTGGRHESVHFVSRDDGRARVHELKDASHILVPDVLQDDRDAVVRSGMTEEQCLQWRQQINVNDNTI